MGLPLGLGVEDSALFLPTMQKLGCFGTFSDNNKQSPHFVLLEKGKFYTFVGCKVIFVHHAICQSIMGA